MAWPRRLFVFTFHAGGRGLAFIPPFLQSNRQGKYYQGALNWKSLGGPSLPRKSVVRLTARRDKTIAIYRGHKVNSVSDSRAGGSGFDTQSGRILSFLLSLIQEGSCQLLAKIRGGIKKF